jgi:hypothetical protein
MHLSAFARFIPPPHGNTVTPLTAPQFNRLKSELGKHNQLPRYLNSAVGRDIGLNNVIPRNWRQVSCAADIRFLYEEQLRTVLGFMALTAYTIRASRSAAGNGGGADRR